MGDIRIAYMTMDESLLLLSDVESALIDWFDPPLNRSEVPARETVSRGCQPLSDKKLAVRLPEEELSILTQYCEENSRTQTEVIRAYIRSLKRKLKKHKQE